MFNVHCVLLASDEVTSCYSCYDSGCYPVALRPPLLVLGPLLPVQKPLLRIVAPLLPVLEQLLLVQAPVQPLLAPLLLITEPLLPVPVALQFSRRAPFRNPETSLDRHGTTTPHIP